MRTALKKFNRRINVTRSLSIQMKWWLTYYIDQQEHKKHFQFLSSFLFHFFFHQMHKTTSVQAKKQLNWVLPLSLSLSSKLYYLWQTYRKWFLHYNSTLLTHSGEVWHSVRYIGDVMASWPNLSAAFGTPTHFYASVLRLDCKLKCI